MCAALILGACGGSTSVGVNLDELPPTVKEKCAHPRTIAKAGLPWEIIAGRLGDELIDCEAKRSIAVDAHQGVGEALE